MVRMELMIQTEAGIEKHGDDGITKLVVKHSSAMAEDPG